jgi:hypothetical protein
MEVLSMRILKIALKVLQVLFIVLGLVGFIMVFADASRLRLPAQAYEEVALLMHLLNTLEVICLFVAAIALQTIIPRTETKQE